MCCEALQNGEPARSSARPTPALAGYHQETGRAGRDGKPARIALFYSRGDATKARQMLQEGASAAGATRKAHEQLAHNLESLNAMVAFADEVTECRRVMLMRHFGEEFDPGQCGGACPLLCARMLWN